MTQRPKRPCAHKGCVEWATHGSYCEKHWQEYTAKVAEKRKKFSAKKDGERLNSAKRGYNNAWNKARTAYLMMHPLCVTCGEPATEVDHIIPHKGNMKLFWDSTNWQSLCHKCHSKKTFSENMEAQSRKKELSVQDKEMGIVFIK